MVEWFSLEALNKGAARFDFVKLENINGHYIRGAEPAKRLYDVMLATAEEVGRADRHRMASAPTRIRCLPPCPSCSRAPRPCSS